MQSKEEFCNLISRTISRAATAALAMATVFSLTVVLTQPAQAQTFKVIHNFTGGQDGGFPMAGLTMDQAGNLYGTTYLGTAFRLSKKGSGWISNPLHGFGGGDDGLDPYGGVVFGPDGGLYGTTSLGGVPGGCDGRGCGTVFSVRPSAAACKTALCPWTETVLHRFSEGSDGTNPISDLIFDQTGNLYGTTNFGGAYGQGTVFELVPSQSGWTENVLYSFTGSSDGSQPWAGLIFDNLGNLYGTTFTGGTYNAGTVFQLTPSGSGWIENVLYSFQEGNDGAGPAGGLIFDSAGNLYGTASVGGAGNGGTAFQLTPSKGAGPWTFTLVYVFSGDNYYGPAGTLVMDAAGNLYGTTYQDGANLCGSVFKLTPTNGGWAYTNLHDFTCSSDGGFPAGNVTFDANGNLYSTASQFGTHGYGTVWEITFP